MRAFPGSSLVGLDIGYFGTFVSDCEVLPECGLAVQHFVDIRRIPDGVLDGVDAVVHLAGISNDPIGNRFEEVTLDINHKASIQLAHQAKRHGASSFVFASSCSMYGAAQNGACTESSPQRHSLRTRARRYGQKEIFSLLLMSASG